MILRRPVSRKGQVVLPKDLREHLGLKEGGMVEFHVRDSEVVLKPALSAEEAVEAYVKVVRKKLTRRVDIKRELESEVEERLAVRR